MDPSEIIKVIQLLIQPSKDNKQSHTESVSHTFDILLQTNISSVEALVNSHNKYLPLKPCVLRMSEHAESVHSRQTTLTDVDDVRWKFVNGLLQLLIELKKSVQQALSEYNVAQASASPGHAPVMSPDTYSFEQQKTLQGAFQFVAVLGISGYVQPGVGIPMSRRSGFASILKPSSDEEYNLVRLIHCTGITLQLTKEPSIDAVLYKVLLNDLLAALCQLVYGTEQWPEQVQYDRSHFSSSLDDLLTRTYQPVIIRELLMLQGTIPNTSANTSATPNRSAAGPSTHVSTPTWLRKRCARLLTDRFTQPTGVQNAMASLISPATVTSQNDWRTCEAVATIIVRCPIMRAELPQYYNNIATQAFVLLHLKHSMQYMRVVLSIIFEIHKIDPNIIFERLEILFRPLNACKRQSDISKDTEAGTLWVKEDQLTECLHDIHTLFTNACLLKSEEFLHYLSPVIHVLFAIYSDTYDSSKEIRLLLEDVFSMYFTRCELNSSVTTAYELVFSRLPTSTVDPPSQAHNHGSEEQNYCHNCVMFQANSEKVYATIVQQRLFDDTRCTVLVHLLQVTKRNELTAEIFLILLEELSSLITNESMDELSSGISTCTLNEHIRSESDSSQVQHNILLLQLVAEISSQIDPAVIQDTRHIVQFAKATMHRAVAVLSVADSDNIQKSDMFSTETVTMALSLLVAVLGSAKNLKKSDFQRLSELHPLLRDLQTVHPEEEVCSMASDISVAIATQCLVMGHSVQDIKGEKRDEKNGEKSTKQGKDVKQKPLIEEIDVVPETKVSKPLITELTDVDPKPDTKPTVIPSTHYTSKSDLDSSTNASEKNTEFQQGLTEVCDPMVEVKGHGLIRLSRLIESKHSEVESSREMLLTLFIENLSHSDSYVYLNAVRGLSSLALLYPEVCLQTVIDAYVAQANVEVKLKVGEVLVKVSKQLGGLMSHYKMTLLPPLLHSCKHSDPLVRASSLSNIGDICKLLHFALANVIHEIFECSSALLQTDSDVGVRRSAGMLLTLLLQGVEAQHIVTLEAVIKSMYKLLKQAASSDPDDIVRLHANLGLDEMNRIMTDIAFPKQSLTKNIYVLDAPP